MLLIYFLDGNTAEVPHATAVKIAAGGAAIGEFVLQCNDKDGKALAWFNPKQVRGFQQRPERGNFVG